jgi:tetratricopeptide (TPR) repeat protein
MVIRKISTILEKRREKKAEKTVERQKLESYRESEEMGKAEQVKKEADRLAHLKQYKTAIEEYSRALEIYPYDEKELAFKRPAEFFFKIYYNMAASHSYMNRLVEAIDFFNKALRIENTEDENKIKALLSKGNSYYLAKQLLKGDETYRIKMESDFDINQKNIDALKKIDEKKNLLQLAHDCFLKATEIDRQNAEAWYKKGHVEFLLHRVKDAMLSFDNVLMIDQGYDNKESIALFDDIKREKGLEVKQSFDDNLQFKTKTGHLVRSKAEKMIANFLFDNNMIFQYNVAVSWADEDNFKANFFIPQLDAYIEHFKYDFIPNYKKLMKWKVKQYEKSKKKLVYTTSEDEKNIEESLKIKLKPYIML